MNDTIHTEQTKMCPMVKPEFNGEILPVINKQTWKGGDKKTWTFLDNGIDWTKGEYGLSYVYEVSENGERKRVYIRPNSPMDIGLSKLLTNNKELKGLTIEVTKTTGKTQKETRYEAIVIK